MRQYSFFDQVVAQEASKTRCRYYAILIAALSAYLQFESVPLAFAVGAALILFALK